MRPAVYASAEAWYNWPDQHGKRHKPAGPDRIRAGKHAAARTPGWKRILENGVLAAAIVLYTLDLWNEGCFRHGQECLITVAGGLSLLNIMSFVFARVRLDLLRAILRKTYAEEIIFSLLLLILSFSWVLMVSEASLVTYADALWYCFAVVTTIGFGEFTAATSIGRILSVILGIYGIVAVALITSIIVNYYGEMKKADPDRPDQQKES